MITFKIDIRGSEALKELSDIVARIFNDPRLMHSIALEARRILVGRTRSGFGVSSDGLPPEQTRKVRLKPLSVNYVNQRKGIVTFRTADGKNVLFKIQKPRLHSLARPGRSNLTLTGQLLDSIAIRSTTQSAQLYFKPQRSEGDITNPELADIVSKERPFFAFTNDEYRTIINFINREVRKKLRQFIR